MGADRFHPFGYCSSEGVPPLRPGPVGTSVVPVPCPRRRDHGRLCGRFRGRLPVPGRGRAVPGGVESRSEGVRPHRCIRTRPVSSSLGALPRRTAKKRGLGKPETITFLGFTQICPGLHAHFLEDPEGGVFLRRRKSRRDRMRAKLREIADGFRKPMQGADRGTGAPAWRRTLRQRSHNHRMTGAKLGKPAARWLPKARILHPWPSQRLDAGHPRQAPVGFAAHAGICARGAG